MESHRDESDQLPEDAPPEEIADDEDEQGAGARKGAEENPGVPDEGGQAAGNPANAG